MKRALLVALLLSLMAVQVRAETVVLDDSASPRQQISTEFRWLVERLDTNAPEDELFRLRGVVSGLEYRLDTSGFIGRRARIYLLFPEDTPGIERGGDARLSWRSRGVFTDGAVTQGERALVFDGVVESAQMSDTLDLTIDLDARALGGPFRLAPRFVLETL